MTQNVKIYWLGPFGVSANGVNGVWIGPGSVANARGWLIMFYRRELFKSER